MATIKLIADASGLEPGERALDNLARTGGQTERKINASMADIERAMGKTGAATGALGGDMRTLERAAVSATGDIARLDRQVDESGKSADIASRSFGKMRGIVAGVVASLGAGIGLGAIASEIASFDTSMAAVSAVTNSTDQELQQLRKTAQDLGISTEFSAAQAADGLKFLGMAGFTAANAMEALPAILDLATADQMALADAADIASNVMSGFGLVATDAARIADVLAAASSRANTSVADLGQAMSTVAPISATLGISLEDTAAAIGIMSDAGIQGERAGTAMRGALASLASPTKAASDALREMGISVSEVNPATNSLSDVMARLQAGGMTAAQAMTIFGREAASGALVLVDGAQKLETFGAGLMNVQGEAKRMADTMRDQLGGDMKSFASAMAGLAIALGEAGLTKALRSAIQGATLFVRMLADNVNPIIDATVNSLRMAGVALIGLAATQIPAATAAIYAFATGGGIAAAATATFTAAVNVARAATIALGGPLGIVWGLIGAAGAAWLVFGDNATTADAAMNTAESSSNALSAALGNISTSASSASGSVIALANDNYKLAESALAAAQAELAKASAMAEIDEDAGYAQYDSLREYRDPAVDAAIADAAAKRQRAQAILDEAVRGQDRAALTVARSANMASEAAAGLALEVDLTLPPLDDMSEGMGGAAKAADVATQSIDKLKQSADNWKTRLESLLSPMEVYNRDMMELDTLHKAGALSAEELAEAQGLVTDELGQSLPMVDDVAKAFGDFIAGGLRDAKGAFDAILGSFKNLIAQMIATAAKNRIMLSLGFGGGGIAGAGQAMAGIPGMGGIGGIGSLGGIGAGLASFGSSVLSGGISALTGFMGGGGISGAMSAVGTQAALMGGGLSSLGVALGAVALPLAALGVAFSFFKKSTKELDAGMRITVDGFETMVETFSKTETKRFWGLSKKRKTEYDDASNEVADPIEDYVADMQSSIMNAAASLGIGADAFDDFSHQIQLSTRGMSQEDAAKAIQDAMSGLGDAFAGMIPGLQRFALEGEGAMETLNRLSTSLSVVNGTLGDLGLNLYDASLEGAGAAASFAELFGSLDAFQQASAAYYQAFYSDGERMARLQELSTKALRDAGLAVPATRDAYRELVEAQNLNTEAGREAAALLIQMAPAFDQLYTAADAARASVIELANAQRQLITDARDLRREMIDGTLTDQQRAAQELARMNRVFADLGVSVPETAAEYRELIRGLDLTTEAGRAALESLNGIGDILLDTFDAALSAAQAAQQSVADARAARRALINGLLTEEQKAAQSEAQILAVFDSLNMAVPNTVEGLQALIQGLDLTTEAGRIALAALTGIADDLEARYNTLRNGRPGQDPDELAEARRRAGIPARTEHEKAVATDAARTAYLQRVSAQTKDLQAQIARLSETEGEKLAREEAEQKAILSRMTPINAALQQTVWNLEKAGKALDTIDKNGFATLVEYELARSRAANRTSAPEEQEKKAQEERSMKDSAVLVDMRNYVREMADETHKLVRQAQENQIANRGITT